MERAVPHAPELLGYGAVLAELLDVPVGEPVGGLVAPPLVKQPIEEAGGEALDRPSSVSFGDEDGPVVVADLLEGDVAGQRREHLEAERGAEVVHRRRGEGSVELAELVGEPAQGVPLVLQALAEARVVRMPALDPRLGKRALQQMDEQVPILGAEIELHRTPPGPRTVA